MIMPESPSGGNAARPDSSAHINGKSCKSAATALLAKRFWPVVTYPPGVEREGRDPTKGKEPMGAAWGAKRLTLGVINDRFNRYPAAGVGMCFGPGRGPNGEWIADFEGDGDQANQSLTQLLDSDEIETTTWGSARGGHNVFIIDGERLLSLLERCGAVEGKGHKSGVYKIPDLPDLEIRVGGFKEDGTVKQVQSVVPPTVGTNGKPREWVRGLDALKPLPEAAYAFLEALARRIESRAAAEKESHNGNGKAHGNSNGNGKAKGFKVDEVYGKTESPQKAWFAKALADEAAAVAGEREGNRRNRLRDAAYNLGGQIHHGYLTKQEIAKELASAGRKSGLSEGEVSETISEGIEDGQANPLGWPKKLDRPETDGKAKRSGARKAREKREGEPDWILTEKGAWSPCVSNIVRWLEWKGQDKDYVLDNFLDTLTVNGREIEDTDPVRLTISVEEDMRVPASTSKAKEAISVVAAKHSVDSLKDYFASISWDGVPRVDTYFERAYDAVAVSFANHQGKIEAEEYDKAVQYSRFVSRSFLIGLAARALSPGCKVDTMPILIADQGFNKSESFRALCPDPEWFTDDIGDIHTKDACANLKGILIVEFAEFNRLMRASAAAAKSFLTKRDDRYREAYGHYTARHLRRCVFVGTTNEDMPLTDIENRRFYPIRVAHADLDYIRQNRDQILAEAAHRFRQGEQWWTRDDEILEVVRDRQDMAQKPDAWTDAIVGSLPFMGETFTQAEAFEKLCIPIERRTGKSVSDMGNALKKAGCKTLPRQRIDGVRTTVYANPWKAKKPEK